MAMMKLRANCGFIYVRDGKPLIGVTLVPDTDPDYLLQKHKFEAASAEDVERVMKHSQSLATFTEWAGLMQMKRPALLAFYKKVFDKDAPEDATIDTLRRMLESRREQAILERERAKTSGNLTEIRA